MICNLENNVKQQNCSFDLVLMNFPPHKPRLLLTSIVNFYAYGKNSCLVIFIHVFWEQTNESSSFRSLVQLCGGFCQLLSLLRYKFPFQISFFSLHIFASENLQSFFNDKRNPLFGEEKKYLHRREVDNAIREEFFDWKIVEEEKLS